MKSAFQILTLTSLMILSLTSYSKSRIGIYTSPSDFLNKKLSFENADKININNSLVNLAYITITEQNKKLKLNKAEVFGYTSKDNKAYRFYKNAEYQIAETGNVNIYIQIEKIAQSKGFNVKKNFYFSSSLGGEIIPLTIDNLKHTYRTNEKFIDLLDQFFGNGDASVYDNIHDTYKVNYVYTKSITNK